jgi:ATP-dependent DNA ligase
MPKNVSGRAGHRLRTGGRGVRLMRRAVRDLTRRFPELATAVAALKAGTLILDGEVCIFDERLVSRFEWLRHGKPPGVATPPIFMAFDCLHAAGRDLRERFEAGTARGEFTLILPSPRFEAAGPETMVE